MSGGQQQRVALARALAIEPRVLLLDEPLSALDAKVRLQLREQIRLLQTQLGTTTLFVTHDQEEALSMADRVGVMRDGRLEQIAPPAELYARPATAFVAEFVGTMNRIPGEVAAGRRAGARHAVARRRHGWPRRRHAVDVLARPEDLTLTAAPHGHGIVTVMTFLGSLTRVTVRLDGDVSVQVDRPSVEAAALAVGAAVEIAVTGRVLVVDPHAREPAPDARSRRRRRDPVGTTHAWEAVRRGHEVLHLEREEEARGATVRNFGLIWVSGRSAAELPAALRARELWEAIGTDVPAVGFRANGSLTVSAPRPSSRWRRRR